MTVRYKKNDEIFTKSTVVQYLLDEVGFVANKDLSEIRLLEPASGDGTFAIEILKRLHQSSKIFNFDFIKAFNKNIRFVEIENNNFEQLKKNVNQLIERFNYATTSINDKVFIKSNFLKLNFLEKFDCIVGNPPYIRYEMIDKELKDFYKINFSTFKYRSDLYIIFFEHSLNLLAKNGKLSFICSNRWLYNQYGQPLREKISKEFHLKKLLNIENNMPFHENVIAYPSITTIENKKANSTLYYETNLKEINFQNIFFKEKKTPKNFNWQNLFLNYDIEHGSLKSIEEQGFKIGIGVATGADSIFIIKKSDNIKIENNRLLPLLKSNALKNDSIEWDGSFVINPFEDEKLCELDDYPYLKHYFLKHKEKLSQRHIAKKNPSQWYKTIDKIKNDLLVKPKLLLPDLSSTKFLFIDKGEYYPHHNLYYITNQNVDKLKILASILMSTFIKEQLSQIGIRMNGGVPRFQSQTLKKLRIPIIEDFTYFDRVQLLNAYDEKNFNLIDKIINKYSCEVF